MKQAKNQRSKRKILNRWLIVGTILFIYIWAFQGVQFTGIKPTALQITGNIMSGLFAPDWGYVYDPEGEDLLRSLIETFSMALLGTFLASIFSIPLSIWAAKSLSRWKWISSLGKGVITFIRTIPSLVLALLFIVAVGPGSFAGVLALALHSLGMLGKLFAEEIENTDLTPAEALIATGGTRLQMIWFGVFPLVIPSFLSYVLYRFEINLRSATVLGMVGAGGIGTPLLFALSTRNWERVGIILLGIILMVTLVDMVSGYLRKKLV